MAFSLPNALTQLVKSSWQGTMALSSISTAQRPSLIESAFRRSAAALKKCFISSDVSERLFIALPSVKRLFTPRGPAAVLGSVVAVVVSPVERLSIWPWPHVGEKFGEVIPPLTDTNSSPAISLERFVVGIHAASPHALPTSVGSSHFSVARLPVFEAATNQPLDVETPARFDFSSEYPAPWGSDYCPTFAAVKPECPVRRKRWPDWCKPSHHPHPAPSKYRLEFCRQLGKSRDQPASVPESFHACRQRP